jgi:hypothetical protein
VRAHLNSRALRRRNELELVSARLKNLSYTFFIECVYVADFFEIESLILAQNERWRRA